MDRTSLFWIVWVVFFLAILLGKCGVNAYYENEAEELNAKQSAHMK